MPASLHARVGSVTLRAAFEPRRPIVARPTGNNAFDDALARISRETAIKLVRFHKHRARQLLHSRHKMGPDLAHLQPHEGVARCVSLLAARRTRGPDVRACLLAYRVLRKREARDLRELEAA